jgi:hypothetical protein
LIGFFANVLVVPTLFLLIPAGLIGAALWGWWPLAGGVLLQASGLGLIYVSRIVQWLGGSPWAYRAVVSPSLLAIAAYYALVFGLALSRARPGAVNNAEVAPGP